MLNAENLIFSDRSSHWLLHHLEVAAQWPLSAVSQGDRFISYFEEHFPWQSYLLDALTRRDSWHQHINAYTTLTLQVL